MTTRATLYAIQSVDPDGGEVEPTEADYRDFENWVVDTFGESAWSDYCADWAERADV